jgi:hypothetical protein
MYVHSDLSNGFFFLAKCKFQTSALLNIRNKGKSNITFLLEIVVERSSVKEM